MTYVYVGVRELCSRAAEETQPGEPFVRIVEDFELQVADYSAGGGDPRYREYWEAHVKREWREAAERAGFVAISPPRVVRRHRDVPTFMTVPYASVVGKVIPLGPGNRPLPSTAPPSVYP